MEFPKHAKDEAPISIVGLDYSSMNTQEHIEKAR